MWGRFSRKEQDLGALQKVLKRFRSPSARREGLVIVYRGNAVRLGVVVLLILVIDSLAFWLLRRRTREEEAALTTPPPEEDVVVGGEEGGPSLEEAVVMPSGFPLAEDTATTPAREAPPPGEERPERRGISRRISLGWPRRAGGWWRGGPREG
jgi:hypothetical protein